MKTSLLLFFLMTTINLMAQNEITEPATVNYVNLEKYTGLWYEIAKIPNRFQKNCKSSTTALYSLMDDGSIKVVNSCREEDGKINSSEGVARVVDNITNSKLEVSFVSIFGIHLFWGDYWIIGLDDEYSYAVIGTPERKYGWILSRTKKLPEEKLTAAFEILKKNGYNRNDFEMTLQED
jgi:apolipoprotein D and lipocalin family protein